QSILSSRSDVLLVAVGPENTGNWRRLSEITGGRLRAVGPQGDVALYHHAADVYLEGFPMGSLTALLEAGLAGLPCVRAPSLSPMPILSDGVALADLDQPRDVDSFVSLVLHLIDDERFRLAIGTELSANIRRHHCGGGWLAYLEDMKRQ